MEERKSPTRSVDRALAILECFLEKDEMILLEVAEKTGLSPSTALRILNALSERGFVGRNNQNKTYHLGSKILWLAEHAVSDSHESLISHALPYMLEMNERYNEDVHLFVPMGNAKLCIKSVDSRRELRQIVKEGSRHDLVRGAAGKVILAYMKEEDRRRILDKNFDTSILEQVREQGYAISHGEREEGLFGLAVPVFDHTTHLAGVISMSGPSVRFVNDGLEEKILLMKSIGEEISNELIHG